MPPGLRAERSDVRGVDQRNRFAFVPSIDAEIIPIHGDDAVFRMKLAHANQTEVGKVRIAIPVTLREGLELREILAAIERNQYDTFSVRARVSRWDRTRIALGAWLAPAALVSPPSYSAMT